MLKIGIEAEGKYKGHQTLFVVGTENSDTILHYSTEHRCKQIYFNADEVYVYDWETILSVANRMKSCIITVEIPWDKKLMNLDTLRKNNIHIMWAMGGHNAILPDDDMRVNIHADKVIMTVSVSSFCNVDRAEYANDEVVKE